MRLSNYNIDKKLGKRVYINIATELKNPHVSLMNSVMFLS